MLKINAWVQQSSNRRNLISFRHKHIQGFGAWVILLPLFGTPTGCRTLAMVIWETAAHSGVWRQGRSRTIFGLFKRLWIPLLVLVVVGGAGFTVSRLHGIFGSEKHTSYSDTRADESETYDPKQMIYEVFGPPGTVANISYFDKDTEPQYITGISLPWTLQFDMGSTTAIGSLMAQGDSDNIGCRIIVDGEVKAERTSNNVNAFTSCLLKNG